MSQQVPKVVFIVPYRNRPQHKFFFSNYLHTTMQEHSLKNEYEVYFSHQTDTRTFNRGATKNIGFLAIKNKYPNDYKNITFVFNDIDTIPFAAIFHYPTVSGVVKHFYGFDYALGGIVALNGGDFEAINGYPNFWGWGMEDTVLQSRCEKKGLVIDRSQFFPIGNPNILHLFDGVHRIINRKDPWRATNDTGLDGLMTIYQLQYTVGTESTNPLDNVHVLHNAPPFFMINITTFMTGTKFEKDGFHMYDLREPPGKILTSTSAYTSASANANNPNNWSHIPFYPTMEKKQEMITKYGKTEAEQIIEYSYMNSTDPTREVLPPSKKNPKEKEGNLLHAKIQAYNESMRRINSTKRIIPSHVNKYSPEYAKLIAAKPRATSSATIRMGGVHF